MNWTDYDDGYPIPNAHTRVRYEAMQVLERCLVEGTPRPIEAFLETYLVQEPPPLLLLIQIADDIEARRQHINVDRLTAAATLPSRALLDQITAFCDDWIVGMATRMAQRAAFQRGAVVAPPLPDERAH